MSTRNQSTKPGMSRGQTRGLGRGLSALMDDYPIAASDDAAIQSGNADIVLLAIDLLVANPFQPRRHFKEEELDNLAASIREKGVLQPILVRPKTAANATEQRYEIIAGERRWRAAQKAGLHDVPVLVQMLDDLAALEIAIIENVQRQDLSPVEEAMGYRRLIDDFAHRQEDIARAIGKSRSHVANLLRLLNLPEPVLQMLDDGRLSMGHARTLVGAPDPLALAETIIADGLSVRAAEVLASLEKSPARDGSGTSRKTAAKKDADTKALEEDLGRALGLSVEINHKGETGGLVTIRYGSLEQLDDLCQRLIER